MLLLGFQHMFAMFGATVLVPVLTGLPVAATLLFAGLGTLLLSPFATMLLGAVGWAGITGASLLMQHVMGIW